MYQYPQQQYPQLQQPPAEEKKPKKPKEEPKPDPTFSKFIDEPDEPIPFFAAKIAIGILSLLGAAWLLYQCYQLGTFRLLAMHAKSNIRGLSLMICAVLWIFAAVCGFVSKFSRGAAGCGGCLYLFSIGIAVTRQADYEHFLWAAIAAGIFAVVFLISAAGGININLDD